jgi:hypothetical protein
MFGFLTRRPAQAVDHRPLFRPHLEWLEDRAVPSTTSLAVAPNPASVGQLVTLTATVTETGTDNVQPGTGTPVGTVTFFDGSTPLAVVGVTRSSTSPTQGTAVFATSGLADGTHSLHATYSGETNPSVPGSSTAPSDSGILTVTVTATATQQQLNRVSFAAFYTAYGYVHANAFSYFFGVSDYLSVVNSVTGPVQQQLAQHYFGSFFLDYFLLTASASSSK